MSDDLISWKELSKRWKKSDYELKDRFVRKGLIPYNSEGQAISPQEVLLNVEDKRDSSEKIKDWTKLGTPMSETETESMFTKLQDMHFDFNNVKALEKEWSLKKDRKLTHGQRCKSLCRTVAQQFWDEDATITIADMIKKKEIIEVSKKSNGKLYGEDTVHNWIMNLCPNRDPGRRPKKAEK